MPSFYRPTKNSRRGKYTEVQREFTELEKKIVRTVIKRIGHMTIAREIQQGRNVVVRIIGDELTTDWDQIIEAANWLSSWRITHKSGTYFLQMAPFPCVAYKRLEYIEFTILDNMVPYFEMLYNGRQPHFLDYV